MTVDILILGAGWTSTFLVSQCKAEGVTYATTNRSGESGAIKFNFPDAADFSKLPDARTVLVTFPLQKGWAKRLTDGYARKANWIALGTTSIWNNDGWNDRNSEHGNMDRSLAEDELDGTVLCLSGLYGGTRDPKNWVTRVAPSKEALKAKVRACVLQSVLITDVLGSGEFASHPRTRCGAVHPGCTQEALSWTVASHRRSCV